MTEEFLEEENKQIAHEYKELLRISYRSLTDDDKKFIRKAFDTAVDAHKEQRRKSGEAYIFHPISVAKIVASEIGMDATSIAAALLHDVVEDTDYTLDDLERLFGVTVAKIVDGLTKISILDKEEDRPISLQAENYRKMLLTLNDDIRVIIIKIADRLHNMQTMDAMRPDKQVKIASETLYIYAPLAHRIGLYNIKTELEDLGLKYTEPDVFKDIQKKITESKEEQDAYIKKFVNLIKGQLDIEHLNYDIKGRPKSIYSIRKKMLKQTVSFDEVYDKFAIRIVYKSDVKNEKFIAWKIYSIVTDNFRANPVRLRDWISNPKSNGYEALHITVMGPENKWVEVQIRSERMHEIAEKGYAAHYKYKNADDKGDRGLDVWLDKLQDVLENHQTNAVDFVEEFKLNLYAKEIFVFTPKGDIKSLPKGATALDFSFSIHTEIGLKTRGVRVNGKIVPLSQELKSGDHVEIITSTQVKPTQHWLNYVTTARARAKIKSSLNEERKSVAREGKEVLARKLRTLKLPNNTKTINELVRFCELKTSHDLYYRFGLGTIDNKHLRDFVQSRNNKFVSFFKNKIRKPSVDEHIHKEEITSNYDLLLFGRDNDKLNYTLSSCCNPIPGDQVFGFLTVNDGIKVHKKNCPNALQMQSNYAYRIMSATWVDSTQQEFKATLNLSGIDNMGLVNDITKVISSHMNVALYNISFSSDGGVFSGSLTVGVKNKGVLKTMIQKLGKIKGIEKITRT